YSPLCGVNRAQNPPTTPWSSSGILSNVLRYSFRSIALAQSSQPGNAEEGMGLLSEFRWTLSFPTSGEYLEHVHASSCQIKVFKTHILSFSSLETQERLHQNNFSTFCRLFTDFSGYYRWESGIAADSLNMSRDDVVQICCPADSIRLFDTIKGRPVN
ncbi:hypothetical protein P4O66_007965, partial [Electrophorus voltai]